MQLYYAAEPRGYPKKYVGNEGSRDMDKIILDGKMRELSIILQEGDTRDCIKTICDLLYGRNKQEDSENTEMGRIWEQKIEATIANSMKSAYQKSANGKVIVPHYSAWRTEKYRFLFTHLDEIEEAYIKIPEKIEKAEDIQIDEVQREKQEKERVQRQYMKAIDNDFGRYYQNIYETIVKSPLFFEADITYILLQELWIESGKSQIFDDEVFELWNDDYGDFLDCFQKKETAPIKYMGDQLRKPGVIPYYYIIEHEDNNEKQEFKMTMANLEFQIALIYYEKFRDLCHGTKKVSYDFETVDKIIENIHKMIEEIIEETESMVFPYMVEKITGMNLCLEFSRYYRIITRLENGKKDIKNHLLHIFNTFCVMPNVFSRAYILKELLEPVIFFDKDRNRQLIIIENRVKQMRKIFSEYVEAIIHAFKQMPKNVRNKYLEEVQKSYRLLKQDMRPIFKEDHHYLFIKSQLNEEEKLLYRKIQKSYINFSLYYINEKKSN